MYVQSGSGHVAVQYFKEDSKGGLSKMTLDLRPEWTGGGSNVKI